MKLTTEEWLLNGQGGGKIQNSNTGIVTGDFTAKMSDWVQFILSIEQQSQGGKGEGGGSSQDWQLTRRSHIKKDEMQVSPLSAESLMIKIPYRHNIIIIIFQWVWNYLTLSNFTENYILDTSVKLAIWKSFQIINLHISSSTSPGLICYNSCSHSHSK